MSKIQDLLMITCIIIDTIDIYLSKPNACSVECFHSVCQRISQTLLSLSLPLCLSLYFVYSQEKKVPKQNMRHMPIIKQPQMISSYKSPPEGHCETMAILQIEIKGRVVGARADIKTKIDW